MTLDFEVLATLAVNETLDWTLGALTVPNYTLPTDFFRKNSSVNVSAGFVTDDRLGMVPAGSRAANPGDGIGVVGV